jgi:cholesterol oxidase
LSSPIDDLRDRYEVVVIGSGYGGAIAASRLARAGRQVCVLERGHEFQPGEYPDTEVEALHQFQVDAPLEHIGSRTGLFDLRVNDGINVFQGCGLGGTSLINAGVCLRPDPRVFDGKPWPREVREGGLEGLEPWFSRAETMLKPKPYPRRLVSLQKQAALARSAKALSGRWYRPPIAVSYADGVNHVGVEQKACILCGDCMTGCNHSAKQTLIMNYLPDAKNHGAVMFTNVAVRSLERAGDRWLIHYQLLDTGREVFHAPTMSVSADLVIVAAGSLGSTEILLRSQKNGLRLSNRLGHGFSGNGDVLGFGYDMSDTINGIGFGHREAGGMEPVGPVITSVIDLRGRPQLGDDMVVEEGAIAGALKPMLPPLFAVAAKVLGKDTIGGRIRGFQHLASEVPGILLGAYHGAMHKTQTYLVMANDDADGKMRLEDDRLRIHWPTVGRAEIFDRINGVLEEATRAVGGVYLKNPIWSELLKHELVTVHPIGGCGMGDSAATGVVNHLGQVFRGSGGTRVHDGLYVLDGAIVPRALGVNPLLTICALAERGVAALARQRGWKFGYTLPSAPPPGSPTGPEALGIEFTETMKGHFSTLEKTDFERGAELGKENGSAFEFTLTIASDDLEDMLSRPEHQGRALGTVVAPALSKSPLTVTNGVFNLFVPDPDQVGLRRMRYRLKLAADEGDRYFMDGFKLIQEEAWTHLWHATTTLYITVHQGDSAEGPVLGKGTLHIRPDDFMRQLTTMRVTGSATLEKRLLSQARFGQYFGGTLFDTYGGILARPNMFNPDAPPRKKRPLHVPAPELHHLTAPDGARLRLAHYAGGDKGPVLLVHGIAASSRVFSIDTVDPNLMEFLYAHGFDVWLLDWRGSPELHSPALPYTADDIAQQDLPAAVAAVRELTGAADVQVVAHCVGAAALLMAMAGGLEGVRSAVCLQFAHRVSAPTAAKIEAGLHLPSFLHALRMKSLDSYVDSHSGWRGKAWEEAFRITHLRDKEGCDSPVCHRLTFMYGLLFHHGNLNAGTHGALHEMFGAASVEIFGQLQRWERAGRLVDADGRDVYLTHLDRLAVPMSFIHGADDACVLAEGTQAAVAELRARNGEDLYQLHVLPGYGHLDSLVGKFVLRDVFPLVREHLEANARVPAATT